MWIDGAYVYAIRKEKLREMKNKIDYGRLTMILGGLSLILFSAKPYILDLIEPAKSIGQVIGENAKNLIESLKGEQQNRNITNSKREIWSNIITISSFLMLAVTMFLSIHSIQNGTKKWYGIGGVLLSIAGLGIYVSNLVIGLIGFVIIAVLVVIIIIVEGL